ncbi:hypothetical protein [Devosia sediminis]|uniref:Uncharacterized protein n=1 Tax=Devosia sediminis TaxID=2798801 RepID=A0A934MJL4_9HYPH|nr:hypothetical protein [Devosia sediminis]MBJ3784188.1 hypothetical protein [Devosia sediminis]
MEIRPFSYEQSELVHAAVPLWRERARLLLADANLHGGMRWKSVRDREYLIHYWTDRATGQKKSKSFGRRSEASEATLATFINKRADLSERFARLDCSTSSWAESARGIGARRLSSFVSNLYREFHVSNIVGVQLVDRDSSLAQSVHLGSNLTGVPPFDPFDVGRGATVLFVPPGVEIDEVAKAVLRTDRRLERSGHAIIGDDGTRAAAVLVEVPHLVGWAVQHGGEDLGAALFQCLGAGSIDAVLPDANWLPLSVSALQPAASVMIAFAAQSAMHGQRLAAIEDYTVHMARLLLDREDPLIFPALDAVPELLEQVQAGGYDGLRI